jgi:pimeloyl-ACP methyl ester carboxylesterase
MAADPVGLESFECDDYDEFQFLEFHAQWAGLPWTSRPTVRRDAVQVQGRTVSFLRWGEGPAELVLLHGSGQNAHTWDTFALAAGRPCVAVDLPGHGRSDWREDSNYMPVATAPTIAELLAAVAPAARVVVGMSLGGLTALRVAGLHPELVAALVLVDITPGRPDIPPRDVAGRPMSLSLLSGPRTYPSWEAMLDATHATMPHRPREAVIPGLRHNARMLDDGTWGWRYDRMSSGTDPRPGLDALWDDLETLAAPTMLVKGALSPIVSEEAEAEMRRRKPTVRVECVEDAGHAVQTDQPTALARLVNDFRP